EQLADPDLDGIEWLRSDCLTCARAQDCQVAFRRPALDDQHLLFGMQEPVVRDLGSEQRLRLRDEVALLVLRRHDLTDPVGPDRHREVVGHLRYPVAPPTGDVMTVDLLAVADVDLRADPPAARPARAAWLAIERRKDLSILGFGAGVAPRWQ